MMGMWISRSGTDPLEPFTTGSLPASQFNASQLPFVDFGDVPIAVIKGWLDLVRSGPVADLGE